MGFESMPKPKKTLAEIIGEPKEVDDRIDALKKDFEPGLADRNLEELRLIVSKRTEKAKEFIRIRDKQLQGGDPEGAIPDLQRRIEELLAEKRAAEDLIQEKQK
jgi:hypothetical protein